MKIKILKESLLLEATYEEAKTIVNGRKYTKQLFGRVKQYVEKEFSKHSHPEKQDYLEDWTETIIGYILNNFKTAIPDDITDVQKGEALLWIKNITVNQIDDLVTFAYQRSIVINLNRKIEKFFKMREAGILPADKSQLSSFISAEQLFRFIDDHESIYQNYINNKKSKVDKAKALEGTELVFEDEKWKVFIPHNKEASCVLGSGTDWCTAKAGQNYYEEYHKPYDPLFIIISKTDPKEKYQFHYGSMQFMNKNDEQLVSTSPQILVSLQHILKEKVSDQYPIINNFEVEKDPSADEYATKEKTQYGKTIETVHKLGILYHSDLLPAYELTDIEGNTFQQEWWWHGLRHNLHGPAKINYTDNVIEYFIYDRYIGSKQKFDEIIQTQAYENIKPEGVEADYYDRSQERELMRNLNIRENKNNKKFKIKILN